MFSRAHCYKHEIGAGVGKIISDKPPTHARSSSTVRAQIRSDEKYTPRSYHKSNKKKFSSTLTIQSQYFFKFINSR